MNQLTFVKEDGEGYDDVSEDNVDYKYDAASLARSGVGHSFARRFRSGGASRSGRRHGKKVGRPRTALDSFAIQQQQRYGEIDDCAETDSGDDSICYDQVRRNEGQGKRGQDREGGRER